MPDSTPAALKLAPRMGEISSFQVMDLLSRAKALEEQGIDVVHMEIGEPDFNTPAPIVAAGIAALQNGLTHYTPALGLPELRAAIARHYQTEYGVTVDPERVIVTPGASGALSALMAALIAPGDQVLMADPGYPCNRNFVRLAEGETVRVPVNIETAYQLTPELVEYFWDDKTKAVLLASPSNPTGTVVPKDDLAGIVEIANRRGGRVIVDEIYHGLLFDAPTTTALALSDQAIVVNSFSKFYGMTGWRLGWMVVPPDLVRQLEKLVQSLFIAAATPAQYAALAAFSPETRAILEERRDILKQRRDFLLPALRGLGFDIPVTPQGAFYLYADCSRLTRSSKALATQLLERAHVAVTPGGDFGEYRADRHIRFAYTTGLDHLEEGVRRIGAFLNGGR